MSAIIRFFPVNNLLSSPALGALGLFALFALSFAGVHFVLLMQRGFAPPKETPKETPKERPKEKPPEAPAPSKQPETVYYIVERKKRRQKSDYTEPRQIHFK